MTKSVNEFKKPCFWPIFGHFPKFWGKIFSPEIRLSCTTSYGFAAPYQNSEKTNDKMPRKHPNKRTDGRTAGKTDRPYFIGPFRLPPKVQINK